MDTAAHVQGSNHHSYLNLTGFFALFLFCPEHMSHVCLLIVHQAENMCHGVGWSSPSFSLVSMGSFPFLPWCVSLSPLVVPTCVQTPAPPQCVGTTRVPCLVVRLFVILDLPRDLDVDLGVSGLAAGRLI